MISLKARAGRTGADVPGRWPAPAPRPVTVAARNSEFPNEFL